MKDHDMGIKKMMTALGVKEGGGGREVDTC